MNIEIKFEGTTGAEARQELMALLGIDPLTINTKTYIPIKGTEETINVEVGKTIEETKFVEEPVKGKRRTKAEIAADEVTKIKENPVSEEVSDQAETIAQDNADQNKKFPELVDLQRACAIIVRAGYKQKGIDIIKNTGKAETSKDVAPELRQACIDELNAFADENQIAR
jgi:hypothetical protein